MTSRLVTNEEHSNFQTEIVRLLADAGPVRIASGYIGHSTFTNEPRLREIVSAGGHVGPICSDSRRNEPKTQSTS